MGWENYLVIALVYSLGCYLSYRAGLRRGFETGIKMFFDDLVKTAGWSRSQAASVLEQIKRHQKKARAK